MALVLPLSAHHQVGCRGGNPPARCAWALQLESCLRHAVGRILGCVFRCGVGHISGGDIPEVEQETESCPF